MKPSLIIALLPHLDKDDASQVQEQLMRGKPMSDIIDFIQRAVTPKQRAVILDRLSKQYPELDQVFDKGIKYLKPHEYRNGIKSELEYVEYLHTLPPEEQEYVRQFYHEYYSNGAYDIPEEKRIMKEDKFIKEANRTNNSLKRDLLNQRLDLTDIEPEQYTEEIQEDDWEHVYKVSGYEAAIDCIVDVAIKELENSLIDKKTVLIRFFIRTDKLRRLNNRDIGRTASFERSRRTKEKNKRRVK